MRARQRKRLVQVGISRARTGPRLTDAPGRVRICDALQLANRKALLWTLFKRSPLPALLWPPLNKARWSAVCDIIPAYCPLLVGLQPQELPDGTWVLSAVHPAGWHGPCASVG